MWGGASVSVENFPGIEDVSGIGEKSFFLRGAGSVSFTM